MAIRADPVGLIEPVDYLRPGLVAKQGNGDGSGAAWWICAGLEESLRARAPGLHASTPMVRQLASRVGARLGLDPEALALLDMSVRVRDVGMLALSDHVVLATAPLSPEDWALVNRHPALGAEMLERLAPVSAVAATVRAHHERWDGRGYPYGQGGSEIPLASRVIAVCDAFVAMSLDRPHRRGVGAEAALERVAHERGAQFDPRVVDALVAVLGDTYARSDSGRSRGRPDAGGPFERSRLHAVRDRQDMMSAIAEFDVVPAFAPAHDRLMAATDQPDPAVREIVSAIESDTGLTVAVLRRAQDAGQRRPIASIPDAVAALTVTEIRDAVEPLPRAEFPWRTTQLEVLMHRSRVHAQAVTRAAVRLARELGKGDDIVVAALLHDIGKLVLGRADARYASAALEDVVPEQRVQEERRTYGLDHASLGGLLLSRWGLPSSLEAVHHVQGEPIDRKVMLRLAGTCGLSAATLRDLLFDLPHSGGSDRRRAEPCPLSARETAVLRLLAQGKLYKVIAAEIGLSPSTVRTHLHNIYAKLMVADRAQAVLKATEKGWI